MLLLMFHLIKKNNMFELFNVYRVQFKKREPILVAGISYVEVLTRLERDNDLSPSEGDEIVSISIVSPSIYV